MQRPPWLPDDRRGLGVPDLYAVAAADHLCPDGHGRRQRDGVGAGTVRLLRPRLPRRHGPVRPRRLRSARRQRRPAGAHRGGPAIPGAGAGGADQGPARPRRRRRRTGSPARTWPPACHSAPDAPKGPGGSEAEDKTSRHPPLPSEDGSLTIYVQEQPPGAAITNRRWTSSRSSPPIAKAMGAAGASDAFECFQASGSDRCGERLVVQFVLVGVALGEVGDRLVEAVASA